MEHHVLPPFFYEIFHPSLPRLGPGDDRSTARALDAALAGRPAGPVRILDLGSGNGAPTLCLASRVDGPILAVDNHPPFLDELRRRAAAAGYGDRIGTAVGDLGAPDPAWGPADLIWSEGAIAVAGVGPALRAWRPLLAPGGRVAFTDLCWFEPDPPAPCADVFTAAYPTMATDADVASAAEQIGYKVLSRFRLPESSWRDGYFAALDRRVADLRTKGGLTSDDAGLLETIAQESTLYERYSRWYGYAFFVLEPVD